MRDEVAVTAPPAADPGLALALRAAVLLFAHGQTTEGTRVAVERMGDGIGRRLTLDARWGELMISDQGGTGGLRAAAMPLAVDMGSVAAAEAVVEDLGARRLDVDVAAEALGAVERRPSVGLVRFATMAGLGAAALSVIFAAADVPTVALVAASAAAGACLRRAASHASDNPFLQPFLAALLAGGVTAGAITLRLPVAPSLVAVCPCMVLVPGPHLLNGLLDLARARIPLGGARLVFAFLVVAAICAGLLAGLSPATAGLPDGGPSPAVPLLHDVLAAGLAVAAYSSFFDMPWRMLPAPIAVGMLAHALRWGLLTHGGGLEAGAFVACLLVGTVMTPVAHRLRMPFGALAFASVVSMIPGVFMFRTASDVLALVGAPTPASLGAVTGLLSAAATALVVLLAMGAGLVVPKMLLDGASALRRR